MFLFKKCFDFKKSWLIFTGKIFSTILLFAILKVKFLVAEIGKTIFLKETFFQT